MQMSGASRAGHVAAGQPTGALAANVKARLLAGDDEGARARFDDLVQATQRRASRLAFYYLRDRADADEAVQDAFVKVFVHLGGFDETQSFDTWFARILVNGCLDRLKARTRRGRWMVDTPPGEAGQPAIDPPAMGPTPEDEVLRAEAARALRAAIDTLPPRQRDVVLLTQLDGRPTAEVSAVTGLSESTVRVHLFRAMRRLRHVLGATRAARVDEG
jgi:RNA polymerase sigma-70 factor (ECF subfamily)